MQRHNRWQPHVAKATEALLILALLLGAWGPQLVDGKQRAKSSKTHKSKRTASAKSGGIQSNVVEMDQTMDEFLAAEKVERAAFKKVAQWVELLPMTKTDTGLQIGTVVEASTCTRQARLGQFLLLNYESRLEIDAKVIDSSYLRKEAVKVELAKGK
jgi:hypothetical protein